MHEITLLDATSNDYSMIARIIAEQNQRPETHCIQSSSTDDPASIADEIKELYAKGELRFVVAKQDGHIVGLMGCEFDESVGRGWTRGPFLTHDHWDRLPGDMLEALLTALPPTIRRLDSFLNQKNTMGHRFYLDNGFKDVALVHVYTAAATEYITSGSVICSEIDETQENAFEELHNSAFPVTFIDGKGILNQLDEDHKLFVYTMGSGLGGYIYVSIDKFAGEGYIEFIAVRPDLRNRGIGKTLLQCALDWCFSTRKVIQVGLTVHEELTNAQSLYTRVGFRHLYTGVNNRREW